MNKTYLATAMVALLTVLFPTQNLIAQISAGGTPTSTQLRTAIPTIAAIPLTPPDAARLAAEDKEIGSVRFAAPIGTSFNATDAGEWTVLPNGDRIWRLHLEAAQAKGLFFIYDEFWLPEGAKLFMYSPDQSQLLGAYTARNNKKSGKFMTGMIRGTGAIVELYEPRAVFGQSEINIAQVMYAYRSDPVNVSDSRYRMDGSEGFAGYGDALDCHININCSQGDNWQDHKRGVVKIWRVFQNGMGSCTGTLINNTENDETPYVLSAFHCTVQLNNPDYDLWRFDFHYEASTCSDPTMEPTFQSILACDYRAGREESDFALLEMSTNIPASYNAYFNGWNRNPTAIPTNSTIIHHPRGDIKKISIDQNMATIQTTVINWSNGVQTPANHHFRAVLDQGTMESGSSGCAMFDQNGLIVGQLHGGNASCSTFETFHGRFSISWDGGTTADTRLRDWLDPNNNGGLTLNGMEQAEPLTASVSGTIQFWNAGNDAMNNVTVKAIGPNDEQTTTTDATGNYTFDLALGENYSIVPERDLLPKNGATLFDMVLVTKHLLNTEQLTSPYAELAADIDKNKSVGVLDLVDLRKLFLNLIISYTYNTSWIFVPADFSFSNDPAGDPYQEKIEIMNLSQDVTAQNFIGIKIGDVNATADPDE
ncbi:MAG: hypothetical protein AB8G15_12535 [Saprospiraceae bacterium]